jgi:tRNA A-37 threonylcarbamoyl transferase component Bud32
VSDRLAALADRYRIERELGAGGMATVYLAHDLKHDRKVAIKVLRPELAAVIGAERFLREIKTIATLQHPHILGLIDSGEVNGTAYYVMPFVEGESLRDRLHREKQLPINDAVRLATEVASALDYAHRHGVIHRDIKPENIMLHDGSALVADFGIALAVSSAGGSRMTETGMSLGTPHYMSPEQAMGEREITARSDVYALGCVTYEMLSGDPPFTGSTAQAIIAKVMTEKPVPPSKMRDTVPEDVEDAVLTALAKLPADRFGSAKEFALALGGQPDGRPAGRSPRRRTSVRQTSRVRILLLGVAIAALPALAFAAGRLSFGRTEPSGVDYVQRTYRDEAINVARFAPDGKTMVYSAVADSSMSELFVIRPDYPAPVSLGLAGAHLLSISSKGEMAVLLDAQFIRHRFFQGTLARVPIGGGAPREVLDSVREADWSPDGTQLAIIRNVTGRDRLEYPIGKVLVEHSGYLSDPRVSPDGKHVAYAEHPWRWDNRGVLKIVDLAGKMTAVSPEFVSLEGSAWLPGGHQAVFSARKDNALAVFALGISGGFRLVLSGAGNLTVQDVLPDGRMLLTRDDAPYRLMLRGLHSSHETDASWLDGSFAPKLSHDGSLLAFSNGGVDAGVTYDVMLRKTDASQVARLGEGVPAGFSPDGKWVLAFVPSSPPRIMVYPTGTGAERRIDVGPYESIGSADWFPDAQSILVCGNHVGEASRCYVHPIGGGAGTAVTPAGIGVGFVSPDGRSVAAFGPSTGHWIYPVAGGSPRAIPGLRLTENVVRWSTDGRALIVGSVSSRSVDRLDLTSGRRESIVTLAPDRPPRRPRMAFVTVADDPRVYAYVVEEYLSSLFTVDGVR